MIRQIAPQFFTTEIPATVSYYKDKLGFECLGMWQDPPVYAIVARDQHAIHFRCAAPPTASPVHGNARADQDRGRRMTDSGRGQRRDAAQAGKIASRRGASGRAPALLLDAESADHW